MLLSTTARFLLSKYYPLIRQDRRTRWRKIRENVIGSVFFSWASFIDRWRTAKTTEEALNAIKIKNFVEVINKTIVDSLKSHLDILHELLDDDHNIWKHLSLSRFSNSISEELIAESRRTRIRSKYSRDITKAEEKVQEPICRVLLVASDAQTMTGMLCSGNVGV